MSIIRPASPIWLTASIAAMITLSSCQSGSSEQQGLASPAAATGSSVPKLETGGPAPAIQQLSSLQPTADQSAQESELKLAFNRLSVGLTRVEWPAGSGSGPVTLHVTLGKPLTLDNEGFYGEVLQTAANAFHKMKLHIVDDEQGITLDTDGNQETLPDSAVINGTVNYFQAESLKHYVPVKAAPAPEPGTLLRSLLDKDWAADRLEELLGKPDSSFNGYATYWSSKVKAAVRDQDHRVGSLLFEPGYTGAVAGALSTKSSRADITALLGAPPFDSPEDAVFGYKLEPYYLFFSGKEAPYEIALYPRASAENRSDTLPGILHSLEQENRLNPVDLKNRLQEGWTDYDYAYSARGYNELRYNSLGLRITNIDSIEPKPYIEIYGNYEGSLSDSIHLPGSTETLSAIPDFPLFRFRLHEDLVFEREKTRLRQNRSIQERAAHEGIPSPDGKQLVAANEGMVFEEAGFFLIHPDGSRPDAERKPGYFTTGYTWLNNRYLIYEVGTVGILAFDTDQLREIPVAANPDSPFSYHLDHVDTDRGVIYYKDGDQSMEKPYSFNKQGSLVFP
jgi:hypothetical protein